MKYCIPTTRIVSTTDFRSNIVQILDDVLRNNKSISLKKNDQLVAVLDIKHHSDIIPVTVKTADVRISFADFLDAIITGDACFAFEFPYGVGFVYCYREPSYKNQFMNQWRGARLKYANNNAKIIEDLKARRLALSQEFSKIEILLDSINDGG